MSMRRSRRSRIEDLRLAIDCLPVRTRQAMLAGVRNNEIIVGAYSDRHGGVCPMLAAHRNGGRTNFASFARAWDEFTGARRPRRATRREIRALRSHLEMSLLTDGGPSDSLTSAAADIRADLEAAGERRNRQRRRPGDPFRGRETKGRGSWLRPARRLDVFEATVAAASEQRSEQAAAELLGDVRESRAAHPAG
jgi:hypothetical protein